MPSSPESSRLFSRWRDPGSGVESLLLTERVAPHQQSFYFTNPSFSADGRFLWLYLAFPPSPGRLLGCLDFATESLRAFPETQFLNASPLVAVDTGTVYWNSAAELWRRGPDPAARPELLNALPDKLIRGRTPHRTATHLTWRADHQAMNFDLEVGHEWHVGEFPLDGSPPQVWQSFDRCYNHGQFSPTDPDLQLINQDSWRDVVTGQARGYNGATDQRYGYNRRMWLLRRGQAAEPIFPEETPLHGHEWWDPDGRHVWYVHYGVGTEIVDIQTRARRLVWPSRRVSHSHSDRTGRYLVSDVCHERLHVSFINLATGREVVIAGDLPPPPPESRCHHVHPHPQFCAGDRYVAYTTTALGRVDFALAEVAALVAATS